MINELKKTYELLPKQPDEIGRRLGVHSHRQEGYEIRLEIYFNERPRFCATYAVAHEELESVKFDYEAYAIETICGFAKKQVGEEAGYA